MAEGRIDHLKDLKGPSNEELAETEAWLSEASDSGRLSLTELREILQMELGQAIEACRELISGQPKNSDNKETFKSILKQMKDKVGPVSLAKSVKEIEAIRSELKAITEKLSAVLKK